MRTVKGLLGLVALFFFIAPAPAHAWWGWLDDLSGPGRFKGPQFEFRLVCFGGDSELKRLVDDLRNVEVLTNNVVVWQNATDQPVRISRADASAAYDAWRHLLADLHNVHLTLPVLSDDELKEASGPILTLRVALKVNEVGDQRSTVDVIPTELAKSLNDARKALKPIVAAVARGIAAINGSGIFLSACSTDTMRRSSIEVAVGFWYAAANPAFANNEEIRLTTLMPEFSFRVFTDPRFDVLDAGVGGGVYWFTSKGFNSVSGVVLEPGRFDFHAPSVWATYSLRGGSANVFRRIAAVPTLRFALIEFPSGFPPDAFAGVGPNRVRLASELLKSLTLFINLDPFVRKAPFLKVDK